MRFEDLLLFYFGDTLDIDALLKPYKRFGVHLGLERIQDLLAALGNPHHQVPIIHVAGSNGKGSVCAYLSSIFTAAGYRVGRYTSPHLLDWTERICLNEKQIEATRLQQLLEQIGVAIDAKTESVTQFEVITAAAWLYFAQEKVDLAVIEVGLGGRLDATNVCDRPLVSIITSLSREHWQRLGPTLADIAREKAGILKSNCPAVIGQLPSAAQEVVAARVTELNCPTVWVEPAQELKHQEQRWAVYEGIEYPLAMLGEVQLLNSALALAAVQILQQQGWDISISAIQQGMAKSCWQGRLQWTTWGNQQLLIDGAHNSAAAQALRQYVDTLPQPVTWVMGMLSTKDHREVFQALLRSNDQLYLAPVPEHSSAVPADLAILAQQVCPHLAVCDACDELFEALELAFQSNHNRQVILCGSLYLLGYFLENCSKEN